MGDGPEAHAADLAVELVRRLPHHLDTELISQLCAELLIVAGDSPYLCQIYEVLYLCII